MRLEGVRYNRLHSGFPVIQPCMCLLQGRKSFPQRFWSNTWISQEEKQSLAQLWMSKVRELALVLSLFISRITFFMYITQHSSAEASSSSPHPHPGCLRRPNSTKKCCQQTWLIWTEAVSFVFTLAHLSRLHHLSCLLFWFSSIEPGWMYPLKDWFQPCKVDNVPELDCAPEVDGIAFCPFNL